LQPAITKAQQTPRCFSKFFAQFDHILTQLMMQGQTTLQGFAGFGQALLATLLTMWLRST
jgi:PII-like signaling protein